MSPDTLRAGGVWRRDYYTVETVIRGYHMYKEVGMPPLDKFYLACRNAAVKCSYAPRFRFSPGLLDWSRTCFTRDNILRVFTSLFGAVILDEGITCESGPSAFGSVELLSWKYLSKDMTVILTTRWLDAQPPKRHAPKISQRKLSRIAPKPRKFSAIRYM